MRWIRFALISVLAAGACPEPPADDTERRAALGRVFGTEA